MYEYFSCRYVSELHICQVPVEVRRGGCLLELVLRSIVSLHWGAEMETCVLCQRSICAS